MSEIRVDTISEKTSANGVTIDGLTIKDGAITATTGTVVFNEASADVDFRVESNANTHAFFLEGSTGNIGIGTSSIDVSTQAGGSGYQVLQIENDNGGQINLDHNDAGTGSTLGMINFNRAGEVLAEIEGVTDGATDNAKINFRTQPDGGALAVRWTIDHNGILFPGATSQGIALGVTAATASNILDDYEEGTYTPTFTVASGSLTVHGSHNTLAYTKIGRVVHVQGEMRFSAVSSPSGNMSLSLPFAVADLAEGAARSTSGAIGQSSFGGTPDATYYFRITGEGTATAFVATHNSGSDTGVNANQVSTSTEMIVSFTFIAA